MSDITGNPSPFDYVEPNESAMNCLDAVNCDNTIKQSCIGSRKNHLNSLNNLLPDRSVTLISGNLIIEK